METRTGSSTSLATGWGWQFHDTLRTLRLALEPDLIEIAKQFKCKHPEKRLELFRRFWPPYKSIVPPGSEFFYFRWAFFDDMPSKRLIQSWQADKPDAIAFCRFLKSELGISHLTSSTRWHLKRLHDFFSETANWYDFVEDWRALYLQVPMTGTILHHLWNTNRDTSIAYVVRPHWEKSKSPDDFPPFDYWVFSRESRRDPIKLSEKVRESEQHPIMLLGAKHNHDAANRFFQNQLFPAFYDADATGGAYYLQQRRKTNYFVFVPVRFREDSNEWIGVVQAEFTEADHNQEDQKIDLTEALSNALNRMADVSSMLYSDLLIAQTQEEFDRVSETDGEISRVSDGPFGRIAQKDDQGRRIMFLEEEEKKKLIRKERDTVWRDISFSSAHKIGNPIFRIDAALNLLRKRIENGQKDEALEVLDLTCASVEKAKEYVSQFKSLRKAQEIDIKPVRLKPVLEETYESIRGQDILCKVECPDELVVLADRQRLLECFEELAMNALKWYDKHEKKLEFVATGPAPQPLPDYLEKNREYALILVRDNGLGIITEEKEAIFSPTYTTRDQGTGFGLFIVRRVLEGHRGSIIEDGKRGEGALFVIYLPMKEF